MITKIKNFLFIYGLRILCLIGAIVLLYILLTRPTEASLLESKIRMQKIEKMLNDKAKEIPYTYNEYGYSKTYIK